MWWPEVIQAMDTRVESLWQVLGLAVVFEFIPLLYK